MKLRILILCALAALAGCHRDSDGALLPRALLPSKPAARPKTPAAPVGGPTAQEQTATMVEAATEGKSQAPVNLKFDLEERPVPGRPLQIAIALLPRIPAGPVTVEVTGTEGLELAPGQSPIEFPQVDADQVYRHNVKVTPTAEGVYLLTFNVSLQHEQVADTRLFSVPIIVTGAAEGAAAATGGSAAPAQHPVAAAQQPKGVTP